MRVLVAGAGAIGQYLGAKLAQGGHDVVLWTRPRQVADIERGITLAEGSSRAVIRLGAAADVHHPLVEAPFDLVVVAVKAYATPELAAVLAGLDACAGASVLSVQNGLGNEEILAGAFGADRVVAGALTVAVERLDATTVTASARGGLSIAPLGGMPHNWLLAAFGQCGINVRAVSDWRALKWSKLCLNLLANGVCAALDWTPAQVYADRVAFGVERACLLEALAVMQRLGLPPVNLVDFPVVALVRAARTLPAAVLRMVLAGRVRRGRGDKLPSLLLDLRAGRCLTEVSALNGAVADEAAKAGLAAPANAKVAAVVAGIARGDLDWNQYRGRPEQLAA